MLGEQLKKALKKRGMEQREVAKQLGVSESTLSKHVNGTRMQKQEKTILQLCEILNVTPNYLFGYEEDNPWCQIEE